jgi:hypothetical protein
VQRHRARAGVGRGDGLAHPRAAAATILGPRPARAHRRPARPDLADQVDSTVGMSFLACIARTASPAPPGSAPPPWPSALQPVAQDGVGEFQIAVLYQPVRGQCARQRRASAANSATAPASREPWPHRGCAPIPADDPRSKAPRPKGPSPARPPALRRLARGARVSAQISHSDPAITPGAPRRRVVAVPVHLLEVPTWAAPAAAAAEEEGRAHWSGSGRGGGGAGTGGPPLTTHAKPRSGSFPSRHLSGPAGLRPPFSYPAAARKETTRWGCGARPVRPRAAPAPFPRAPSASSAPAPRKDRPWASSRTDPGSPTRPSPASRTAPSTAPLRVPQLGHTRRRPGPLGRGRPRGRIRALPPLRLPRLPLGSPHHDRARPEGPRAPHPRLRGPPRHAGGRLDLRHRFPRRHGRHADGAPVPARRLPQGRPPGHDQGHGSRPVGPGARDHRV